MEPSMEPGDMSFLLSPSINKLDDCQGKSDMGPDSVSTTVNYSKNPGMPLGTSFRALRGIWSLHAWEA